MCTWCAEKNTGSPGTGVTRGCELNQVLKNSDSLIPKPFLQPPKVYCIVTGIIPVKD